MDDHEARVRTLAYHLWEAAGRPHGREDEFWHAAERQIASRPAPAQPPAPASPATGAAARPTAAKRAPRKAVAPRKPRPKR
jgi:hypothetical protein